MLKNTHAKGFTLIEVLLVIAILAILAAVVIVAINPAKQFGEAQNSQRRSDVRALLDAIHQYSIDNLGALPADGIQVTDSCATAVDDICRSAVSCDGINLDVLTDGQKYLVDIPHDPTDYNDDLTGYRIYVTSNDRVGICAPYAYDGADISVIQ